MHKYSLEVGLDCQYIVILKTLLLVDIVDFKTERDRQLVLSKEFRFNLRLQQVERDK